MTNGSSPWAVCVSSCIPDPALYPLDLVAFGITDIDPVVEIDHGRRFRDKLEQLELLDTHCLHDRLPLERGGGGRQHGPS